MAHSGRHRATPPHPTGTDVPSGRPRRQRHELLAAAGGAVLVAVIGTCTGWSHHGSTAAAPVAATRAEARPADAVPPGASAMHGPLRAWLSRAEPSIDALLTARHLIASAAANNDIARTGATCASAQDAVAALQQSLPSPDARLTNAFQQAINRYGVGLDYCVSGARNQDGHVMARAVGYIRQANGELQAAVELVMAQVPGAVPGAPVLTV
jgi:hypothetical protein